MAEVQEIVGNPRDAAHYWAEYEKWVPKFNDKFYSDNEKGYWYPNEGDHLINASADKLRKLDPTIGAQTSQLLALYLGLVPEDKLSEVTDVLVRNIEKNGYKLKTGVHGTRALFSILADRGFVDLACEMFLQEETPSYGGMAKKGATTITEKWPASYGPRSHPGLAAGISWIFSNLAGIQPLTPGFKQIRLVPVFPKQLTWVKSSYDSPYGTIHSAWKKQTDGTVEWNVTVPPNTTASAEAPQGMTFEDGSTRRELVAGSRCLVLKTQSL